MKYWEDVVCSHEDGFHSDCFGCGFKFCKEHSFLAKEKDDAIASAIEAREREIAEKIAMEAVDLCENSQEFKHKVLSIINPSKKCL